jgi:predicted NUDIX family NTP pyrophosphohydrolase
MKISAGLLIYRFKNQFQILLVHPGGPYWQNKDENSWSIPKGEIENNNDLLLEAIRELEEETGLKIDEGDKNKIFYLGEVKGTNKLVKIFCLEKDFGDNLDIKSNLIEIEWPPKSGKKIEIFEVDKAQYFDLETAKSKLVNYQKNIVDLFMEKFKIINNNK